MEDEFQRVINEFLNHPILGIFLKASGYDALLRKYAFELFSIINQDPRGKEILNEIKHFKKHS